MQPVSEAAYRRYEWADPGRHELVADVDGDGRVEVLFVERPAGFRQSGTVLLCFDENGAIRWRFAFGRERRVGARVFPKAYDGYLIGATQHGEQRYVVAHATQLPYFPDQVVLLDPKDGGLLDEYWHPGHFYAAKLFDLKGDGREELLLGGVNNPDDAIGHASLAVLTIPFGGEGSGDTPNYFGNPGGQEIEYILFPRPSLFDATKRLPGSFGIAAWPSDLLQVEVGIPSSKIIYTFNHELTLKDVRPSDDLLRTHYKLFQEGKLQELAAEERDAWKHLLRFNTAPDTDTPEIVAMFKEAQIKPGEGFH